MKTEFYIKLYNKAGFLLWQLIYETENIQLFVKEIVDIYNRENETKDRSTPDKDLVATQVTWVMADDAIKSLRHRGNTYRKYYGDPEAEITEEITEKYGLYGLCPTCGAKGESRERGPNGNDECTNGHKYPSRDSITHPNEFKG